LSSVKPFTNRLLTWSGIPTGKPGNLVRSYQGLMRRLWATSHVLDMHAFKEHAGPALADNGFQGIRRVDLQHDAHDFLDHLLDLVHEGTKPPENGAGVDSLPAPSLCEDFFHGQLRSTIVCPNCSFVRSTEEPVTTLQVPILSKQVVVRVQVWCSSTSTFEDVQFSLSPKATVRDLRIKIQQYKASRSNRGAGKKRRRATRVTTTPVALPRVGKPGFHTPTPEWVSDYRSGACVGPVFVQDMLKHCAAALYSFSKEEERSLESLLRVSDNLLLAGLAQPMPAVVTLNECLNHCFFNTETLDAQNKWVCSCCETPVCATRQFRLSRLPNVLVVQLKRFEVDLSLSVGTEKREDLVDFPCGLEQLDMKPFLVEGIDVSSTYSLNAVVQHRSRSAHTGHYTAVSRHQHSDQWYFFDDAAVPVRVEGTGLHDTVVASSAYLLFYQKNP
jgi:hypothetical protein